MPRKVYLHIGAPKTGTTYLQDRLAVNRKSLADHGVHYPLPGLRLASHFHAALDLLGLPWGFEDTTGHWEKMVRTVNRLDGTVIISHEVLASATREQVRRARESFKDAEVHVVYSPARPRPTDPGRMAGEHQEPEDLELQTVRQAGPHQAATQRRMVVLEAQSSSTCSSGGVRTSRRSGCTWSSCRRAVRPRRAVASLLPRVRDRPRLGARGGEQREPVHRCGRDDHDPPPEQAVAHHRPGALGEA